MKKTFNGFDEFKNFCKRHCWGDKKSKKERFSIEVKSFKWNTDYLVNENFEEIKVEVIEIEYEEVIPYSYGTTE